MGGDESRVHQAAIKFRRCVFLHLCYLLVMNLASMSALPFELKQDIFENAANSDRRSALSLTPVARRVQFW
ncbi:uncharacterized protein F5147DRAFT_30250 [Suillus discolor]|uniref:Uncharacterized protein n=1 Tax=Suillus discolor TaxID=1912936 RepID=A0A9P7JM90_9AGAM|nr:uncharacterized protein F5147DRAFT_30250 [Suillus discolor]KAG2089838.1 hypothetical protein F5147DRAFT_30250 [Suillus discolor]